MGYIFHGFTYGLFQGSYSNDTILTAKVVKENYSTIYYLVCSSITSIGKLNSDHYG